MTPGMLAIIFFTAGAALLVAEVLLPTHGLLGILGAVGLICGVGACFYINEYLGLTAAVTVVFAAPFAAALWVKVWPHTPAGKALILAPPAPGGPAAPHAVQVGQVGVVVSELRPGGVCEFGRPVGPLTGAAVAAAGERVEARSERGAVIPAGRRVEVVAVVDGRPLVRAIDAEAGAQTV